MNNRKVLYGIIFSFLLIGIIGLSYAYFSSSVSGNDTSEKIIVDTMKLSLIYVDGKEIKGENVSPGWEVIKTISVENVGTEGAFFDIVWKSLDNTITNNDFLIKGDCKDKNGNYCSGITERSIEETENGIKTGIYIPVGEKYTYDIKFAFANKNKDQNYNQGSHFYGVVNIKESNKTYKLSGTLTNKNGQAVANTKILINNNEVTTDSNGNYTINNVSLGNNKVEIDGSIKNIKLVTGEPASNKENELVLNDDLNEGKINIKIDNGIEEIKIFPMTVTEYMLADNVVQSDENLNLAYDKDGCGFEQGYESDVLTCPEGCTQSDDDEIVCEEGKGDTNGKGLYYTSNTSLTEKGKIVYYYRGDVSNNNILFGGYCFNIVRTNEDGSVKLVFSGLATSNNGNYSCPNFENRNVIGSSAFNNTYADATFVGYMTSYPPADVTGAGTYSSKSIEEATNNKYDSTIKKLIDNWYETYFIENEDLIADTIYCNDRSLFNGTAVGVIPSITPGFGKNKTNYSPIDRVLNFKNPQYLCNQDNDKFTTSSINGNGKLIYPIAMLTSDEITYAGNTIGSRSKTYLYSLNEVWVMSPLSYTGVRGGGLKIYKGMFGGKLGVNFETNVIPAVSIKSNVTVLSGNGTINNPYRVDNVEIKTDGVLK